MNMNKFKMNGMWQKLWPHMLAFLVFLMLTIVYFMPVLQGKVLSQMDDIHAKGAAQELVDYQKKTGEYAQWTNSMFGGMPAYQIKSDSSQNIYKVFNKVGRLNLPYTTMGILFMYFLGFYLLMISLDIKPWIAIVGAVAFALGSYNIIIIAAGHITKAYAIAVMPIVIAGVIMIFKEKRLVGGLYTMVSLGMELAYNHVQITYYLALTIMVMLIAKLVYAIKEKRLKSYFISCGVLVGATLLAVLPGTTNLWTTYEYGKYSTRGGSELAAKPGEKQHNGLDKDYALDWSYGIHETPTLLIPNVVGGESELIGYDNKALANMDPQIREAVAQQVSKYWGGRGFTSGPVYAGAVVCFLFFLGCFFYRGKEKWWLIAATIFSILLAWGKNFMLLTDFMFYYFPLYNKFRTVEMALVIASTTIPILGFLGLKELYDNPELIKYNVGKFFGAVGLTAGVALLIAIAPTLFYDFMSDSEKMQFAQMKAQDTNGIYALFEQGIIDARIVLTRNDAMRSALFIFLASSALWFFSTRKINSKIALASLGLLILVDMWNVDKRYLKESDFVKKSESRSFAMTTADKAILADTEPNRVFSVYRNPFNEVNTSYYHQSIGGYHGAKLRRYQDVIDYYLNPELQQIAGAIKNQDIEAVSNALANSPALNMLNAKYVIYNPNADPIKNPYAHGAAWFVETVKKVSTADEAITGIGEEDLRQVALVEGNCEVPLSYVKDSLAVIERVSYKPDELIYRVDTKNDALAVFSEIFYPAGWKAFIDGENAPILQADYLLRALYIPSGSHEVRFEFRPQSYEVGKTVSWIGSILVVLLLIAGIVFGSNKTKMVD